MKAYRKLTAEEMGKLRMELIAATGKLIPEAFGNQDRPQPDCTDEPVYQKLNFGSLD